MKKIIIKPTDRECRFEGWKDDAPYIRMYVPKPMFTNGFGSIQLAEVKGINGMIHTINYAMQVKIWQADDPLARLQKYIDGIRKWNNIRASVVETYHKPDRRRFFRYSTLYTHNRKVAARMYDYLAENNIHNPWSSHDPRTRLGFHSYEMTGSRKLINAMAQDLFDKFSGRIEAKRTVWKPHESRAHTWVLDYHQPFELELR